MQRIKRIVSIIFTWLIIIAIGFGIYKLIEFNNYRKTQIETININCIVTEVEYWQPGRKSVAQLDPEWKVKTSCGYSHTLRYKVVPGDTIRIKILRFKQ